MINHYSQFRRTRFILSGWYTLILCIILFGFSVALTITHDNDVTRIVLKQDFGNHIPKALSKSELLVVTQQVKELKSTSLLDLLAIDAITLFIGMGLSYFLAQKTLEPIQRNIEDQNTFIADASHELRSPITTIQTSCEVLLRSTNKPKEDYIKVVESVFEQSQRLGRLVTDLMRISVLRTPGSKAIVCSCSLSSLALQETENMVHRAQKKKIVLIHKIDEDVIIHAEENKIRQLLVILIDNAIKFTSEKGVITVSVIQSSRPQLLVTDTGIGIPPELHSKIFDRFYQANTSRSGEGAGLGLSIARSIMDAYAGSISVHSKPNKGSSFVCTFLR